MDENQMNHGETQARAHKVMAMTMAAGGAMLVAVGAMFLMGIFFELDQMIGGILLAAGFAELGMAWFFFNKSLNTN